MGRPWVARDFNPGRRAVPYHYLLARRTAEPAESFSPSGASGRTAQAGDLPHPASLLRHAPADKRLRHPDGPGASGAPEREDDDDLYPRAQPGWPRSQKSSRFAVGLLAPRSEEGFPRGGRRRRHSDSTARRLSATPYLSIRKRIRLSPSGSYSRQLTDSAYIGTPFSKTESTYRHV